MSKAEQEALEAMVDVWGLGAVIDSLASICAGKAETLRSSLGDNALAKALDTDATTLEKAFTLICSDERRV